MTNQTRRRLSAAFTIALLVLAAVLGLTVFFGAASDDEGRDTASFPAFLTEDKRIDPAFGANLSDYIADRLPFRGLFLRGYAGLRGLLFREDLGGSVVIGKDGDLFFGETVDSFTGMRKLSDRSVFALTDALSQIDAYCRENGMTFVFTVAPNKNTIRPQNMPARYVRTDESDLDRLAESLAGTGIAFADPREALKSRGGLYYKTDSHWNAEGAAIAFDAILKAAGRTAPGSVVNAPIRTDSTFSGDVAELLPAGLRPTEPEQKPDIPEVWRTKRRMNTTMDPVIETVCGTGEGIVTVYRDSFGNALFPLFASTFGETAYLRALPVDPVGAKERGSDLLVWELVERHLGQAVNCVPRVPSSPVDLPEGDVLPGSVTIRVTEDGELIKLSGLAPEKLLADETRAGVVLKGADGAWQAYTAFQLCETEDLSDDTVDNGFTAFLPADVWTGGADAMLSLTNGNETTYIKAELVYSEGDR